MRDCWTIGDTLKTPVVREDAPQHLIVKLAMAKERTAQQAFLHCADLAERAVAAAVGHGGTGLKALCAHDIECEVENQARPFEEDARAPEL